MGTTHTLNHLVKRSPQMEASLLSTLNVTERLLVAETEPATLELLNEDDVVELHRRIRRARNKYVGQYRRKAAKGVHKNGGRGKAGPKNKRSRKKAEAFEIALSRVSSRLAVLAEQSARELRKERLAAARAAKAGRKPDPGGADAAAEAGGSGPKHPDATAGAAGLDRSVSNPISAKQRAVQRAHGARKQAKRDARN